MFSDPDATWGHRSAVSTRKGGGFYGYKPHMATCSRTGLPLAWQVQTGKEADMRQVESLLGQLAGRGVRPATAAMDRGYDYKDVYVRCASYGVLPIVSKRSSSGTGNGPIDRSSERFKTLYRARASVEREFRYSLLGAFGVMGQGRGEGWQRWGTASMETECV